MANAIRDRATASRTAIEMFLDERSIEISRDIEEVLRQAIEDCDELVVLLTPASLCSSWVLTEVGAAWGFEKPIAAVIYSVNVDELPDVIRAKRTVELGEFDHYVEQLMRRARARTS